MPACQPITDVRPTRGCYARTYAQNKQNRAKSNRATSHSTFRSTGVSLHRSKGSFAGSGVHGSPIFWVSRQGVDRPLSPRPSDVHVATVEAILSKLADHVFPFCADHNT